MLTLKAPARTILLDVVVNSLVVYLGLGTGKLDSGTWQGRVKVTL
jgi:hypothetical protein